jgi:hypothetical protein
MSAQGTPAEPRSNGILVPQPHGGAIKQGGVHENSGRLTKELTELLAAKQRKATELLTGVLDVLKTIAEDQKLSPEDRIAAITELRENAEKRDSKASLELNDNRQYSAKIVYLPQLGVEVHQIPESANGNEEHIE